MKVKTVVRFRDLTQDSIREVGEVFDADWPRAEMLISKKFVEKVESKKESAEGSLGTV